MCHVILQFLDGLSSRCSKSVFRQQCLAVLGPINLLQVLDLHFLLSQSKGDNADSRYLGLRLSSILPRSRSIDRTKKGTGICSSNEAPACAVT